jgi:hypothetical protein
MNELHPESVSQEPSGDLGTSGRIALAGFALVAAYFLWTERT